MTKAERSQNITLQPKVAVDAVLFAVIGGELKVLLIKIINGFYQGKWTLPGGLVGNDESLDEAAKRVLFQKTNIGDIHLEQLYSFGDPKRDARERSISIAYFSLVDDIRKHHLRTTSYYSDISWFPVDRLPQMAFDHREIVAFALARLKAKVGYSNIAYSLLPSEFTLTDLQKVYEIILGEEIDKRNFRKKMLSLGLVEETGQKRSGVPNRPAKLYQFSKRELVFI